MASGETIKVGSENQKLLKDDELELFHLLSVIWRQRSIVYGFALAALALSLFVNLTSKNEYKAEVLLAPVMDGQGGSFSGIVDQFGGLASMAGISLPKSGGELEQALAVLKSRAFITSFIENRDLYLPLFGRKTEGLFSDVWVVDADKYDISEGGWLLNEKGESKKPTPIQAYRKFMSLLKVHEEKETGLVKVSLKWVEPEEARDWLVFLIGDLNAHLKAQDVEEAKKSIDYLTESLKKTSVLGLREVFYRLIESQTKTMMLAEIRGEYALKTIDPAMTPDEALKSNGTLFVLVSLVMGAVFGSVVALVLEMKAQSHGRGGVAGYKADHTESN